MQAALVTHEAQLCAAVSGARLAVADPDAFVDLAIAEGLGPLLSLSPTSADLPERPRAVLQEQIRRQLALAAIREPELRRVLDAFAQAGVDVLVIKGAHLSYTVYGAPALRPRNDTDLLVRPGCEGEARHVLAQLGYQQVPAITGAAVQGQAIFEHESLPGSVMDVHWRLASPIVAADLFDFDALWTRAQPIAPLGPAARGPNLADALAIAAVHLFAHHPNERGLLWLKDIALLASALNGDQRSELIRKARERRMTTVLAAALRNAEERFPAVAIQELLSALEVDPSEPSAQLLSTPSAARRAMHDVRTLRTWKDRTAYLAGHLFPPPDYMRRRYAPDSRAPLAWLYATRILRGSLKWFSPGLKTRPTSR